MNIPLAKKAKQSPSVRAKRLLAEIARTPISQVYAICTGHQPQDGRGRAVWYDDACYTVILDDRANTFEDEYFGDRGDTLRLVQIARSIDRLGAAIWFAEARGIDVREKEVLRALRQNHGYADDVADGEEFVRWRHSVQRVIQDGWTTMDRTEQWSYFQSYWNGRRRR